MSRNRDRLGSTGAQATGAPPPQAMDNSGGGFSFVVPTEFVELPSKGRYYPEGHPLHNQETIEIKHLTAKEEDMLTSRALLKKGVALERVIASIIVDKTINPRALLSGDRNAILVAMRISAYGNEYSTKVTCPSCNTTGTHSFDLFDIELRHGTTPEALQVTELGGGFFETKLPLTECNVVFRLLNGNDEKVLTDQMQNSRKRKKEETNITNQLKMITVSVNGDESPETLNYFINNVPSLDSTHLRMAFKNATPTIDMEQQFTCDECGYEAEMEVPLTADFFWPNR